MFMNRFAFDTIQGSYNQNKQQNNLFLFSKFCTFHILKTLLGDQILKRTRGESRKFQLNTIDRCSGFRVCPDSSHPNIPVTRLRYPSTSIHSILHEPGNWCKPTAGTKLQKINCDRPRGGDPEGPRGPPVPRDLCRPSRRRVTVSESQYSHSHSLSNTVSRLRQMPQQGSTAMPLYRLPQPSSSMTRHQTHFMLLKKFK